MMVAWFAPNVQLAQKLFWMHPMDLLVDVGHVESPLARKSFWMDRMQLLGDVGHVESR
jgi:hypothetical protein